MPYDHLSVELIPEDRVIPQGVREAVILTDYAVASRYPGAYEPVEDEELLEALAMAETVVTWAEGEVKEPEDHVSRTQSRFPSRGGKGKRRSRWGARRTVPSSASGVGRQEVCPCLPGKNKVKVCWSQRVPGFQATIIALMSSPKP